LSARKIGQWLNSKGVMVGLQGIRSFRKTLMVEPAGQKAYVNERFAEFDRVVNAIEEHTDLLKIQRERIDEMRNKEKDTGKHNKQLSFQLKDFSTNLREHLVLRQMLGQLPDKDDKTQKQALTQLYTRVLKQNKKKVNA